MSARHSRFWLGFGSIAFVALIALLRYERQFVMDHGPVLPPAPEPIPVAGSAAAPVAILPTQEFGEMQPHSQADFSHVTLYQGDQWIRSVWRACNTGEVDAHSEWRDPPPHEHGRMYLAACYALAGRHDTARDIVEAFPTDSEKTLAVGIMSTVFFPAREEKRYAVIAPTMELALEHWPTMTGAMYDAGEARLALGDLAQARAHLRNYFWANLWYSNSSPAVLTRQERAARMLASIDSVIPEA